MEKKRVGEEARNKCFLNHQKIDISKQKDPIFTNHMTTIERCQSQIKRPFHLFCMLKSVPTFLMTVLMEDNKLALNYNVQHLRYTYNSPSIHP